VPWASAFNVDAEERNDDLADGWGPDGFAGGVGRARALPVD
jgi:hypothetical protein